jgi:glycerophosphoryl diester phosphodiesterase
MTREKPAILAHSGALLNAPENTIAAFKLAFANGADGIECDIRKTKDGQFVAFHDRTAKRVTGYDWPIAGCTYGHLGSLRVNGREPIAHLDDIFNLLVFHPSKTAYFEVCFEDPADAAVLAVRIKNAGLAGRAYVLAFSNRKQFLYAAKCAAPDIGIAVMPFFPYNIVNAAGAAGASAVCTGWTPSWPGTRELFKLGARVFDLKLQAAEARARGLELSAGVANDNYDARWLADTGVNGIWTDDVPLIARALHGG